MIVLYLRLTDRQTVGFKLSDLNGKLHKIKYVIWLLHFRSLSQDLKRLLVAAEQGEILPPKEDHMK